MTGDLILFFLLTNIYHFRDRGINYTPYETLQRRRSSHRPYQMCLLGANEIVGMINYTSHIIFVKRFKNNCHEYHVCRLICLII